MSATITFQKPNPLIFLRAALLGTTVLGALAFWQFGAQLVAEGLIVTSLNFRAAVWGGYVFTVVCAILAIGSWTKAAPRILRLFSRIQNWIGRLGVFAPILLILLLIALPVLVLGFYGRFLLNPFPRLFLFWLFALAATSLLSAWRRKSWLSSLPAAALGLASLYLAAAFLNLVSTFPFSLEWSEGSRYYQASFYFSQQVYGVQLPLPVTHPSRYLLQALPFLISNSPLWLHRLWQSVLWISMPLLTGWLLLRRLRIRDRQLGLLFIGWSFLFLMQGAVFYHLLPCVFLVLLGFDKERPWRSFLFVALASIWAGISRINWIPVPGAVAALIYLLEEKALRAGALSLRYLWQPLLYGIGGALIALGSYVFYIAHSGVGDVSQFGSAFTSELLWDRLLPNAAFPPGVLLGIALVSAPLLTALLQLLRRNGSLGIWRGFAIFTILAVFFAGGLVVSVKIGGGTNLHNLDAYMSLLWVLTSVIVFGSFASQSAKKLPPLRLAWPLVGGLLVVPILFAVFSGAPLFLPDRKLADEALIKIQQMADEALQQGGEVLFISQRHLLTFYLIKNVPLVPDYEKLFLMEMAISNNANYLSRFDRDIDRQRFALIITDPLNNKIEDESDDVLAPENNAWVRNVSEVILCAYDSAVTFDELNIELLTPRYGHKCNQ